MSYSSRIYRPIVPETRDWWFSLDSRVKEDIIDTAFRGHIKYEFGSTQVVLKASTTKHEHNLST